MTPGSKELLQLDLATIKLPEGHELVKVELGNNVSFERQPPSNQTSMFLGLMEVLVVTFSDPTLYTYEAFVLDGKWQIGDHPCYEEPVR